MRFILIIVFVLVSFLSFGQGGPKPIKLFSDSSGYISDFQFFWRNANGGYKLKIKKDSINVYKLLRLLNVTAPPASYNLLVHGADSGTYQVPVSAFLSSGTYTPTLTNGTNVAASTAYPCQYMQVGNTVTVSGKIDIDPTGAGATILGISLPIASALTNDYQAGGTSSAGIELYAGSIKGDATNDRVQLDYVIPITGSTGNTSWYFSFTYQIL